MTEIDPLFEMMVSCSYCGGQLGTNIRCFWCRSCSGITAPEDDLWATPCSVCEEIWGSNKDCSWCDYA